MKKNLLLQREKIEWSNTYIENANIPNSKRLLVIGDSVFRDFRGRMSEVLPNIAVDYIGSSSIFEDNMLFDIIKTFFKFSEYKHQAVLINIGSQHGFYLKCKNKKSDAEKYKESLIKFIQFIKKYNKNIAIISATPNSNKKSPYSLDEKTNKEIEKRNSIQKEIAENLNIPYIDLYNIIKNNYLDHPYKDRQHFANLYSQLFLARKVLQGLCKWQNLENMHIEFNHGIKLLSKKIQQNIPQQYKNKNNFIKKLIKTLSNIF